MAKELFTRIEASAANISSVKKDLVRLADSRRMEVREYYDALRKIIDEEE